MNFLKPNLDQLQGSLRNASTAVIAFAAGRHWLGEDTAALLLALLPLVGPFIWTFLAHTTSAKIAAVEAIPEVKAIVVDKPSEESALQAIVNDDTRPKVINGDGKKRDS